jgi:hypothetical protein
MWSCDLLNPWCMWWKQSNMLYSMYHPPSPPRLSILITLQTNTQYKVIICQVLSTVHIHHTLPKAEEGRHTNPSSCIIQTLHLPKLNYHLYLAFYLQIALFYHFIPSVIRLGLRGPSTLRAPNRLLPICCATYFLSPQLSFIWWRKKNLHHNYMKNPQQGADEKPQTETTVKSYKRRQEHSQLCFII